MFLLCMMFILFFFFKQKTAYEMRISDWSSDVCSSDLNPKLGTVTPNVAQAVKDAKGGQVEFRVEKQGIIHSGIGKLSFDDAALKANFKALTRAVVKAKPSGPKGKYVRKVNMTSSMGPGLKLEIGRASCRERVGK